ncbi:UNVERIFIED_CONTAM: hypothetical protein Slati_3895700 [Sesamum latifolium]|uniref:RNase H type-1 domain-containing protein n=1 Tax=Sesamum latifolium TaxID=2727402 RepID=A0AAW2TMS8_9LAMI
MTGTPSGNAPKDEKWLLHVNGSSTIQGNGAGIVITSQQGEDLEFTVKFGFKASNNKAEYEALVAGVKMAHEAGARHLLVYSDSQLVVKQVEGIYEAKEENMVQYLQQIAELRTCFESFQIIQISREENIKADCLSKLASALEDFEPDTLLYNTSLNQGLPYDPSNIFSDRFENAHNRMVGERAPPRQSMGSIQAQGTSRTIPHTRRNSL